MAQYKLHPRHAFGIFPGSFNDALCYLDDDLFIFAVGCHLAVYDTVTLKMAFIPHDAKNKQITAMSKAPHAKYLAVAEKSLVSGLVERFDIVPYSDFSAK